MSAQSESRDPLPGASVGRWAHAGLRRRADAPTSRFGRSTGDVRSAFATTRFGWVDARVQRLAARRGVVLGVRPVVLVGSGAMAGAALGLLAGGVVVAVGVIVGAVAPIVAVARWPDQRAVRFEAQVPAFLDAVARSLRGGRSLTRAVTDAAHAAPLPLGADARALVLRIEAGVALRDVVRGAAVHTPSESWRTALVAIGVAHDAGGPQAMVLDSLAASMRARQVAVRELRALAAPVRLSAIVIAVAPLVVFGGVAATDPAVIATAIGTPVGAVCVAAGAVLDAAGFWWIRALTRPR